jgi:hypothetical protein
MTRGWVLACVAVACGGTTPPPPNPTGSGSGGVVRDTRSELVKRRDAACEQLSPRLYDCALSDAKAAVAAGTIKPAVLAELETPKMKEHFFDDWLTKCRVDMSSRQVRVLEVCYREEAACEPLGECLKNLAPAK